MNRRSAMRKSKRFFTLVEMIVAMAVMIFVALIIATASMTFYNAWQRTVRVSDRLKTCQAIDRIMDNCIRNMIPFRWKDKDLDQERVVFKGEPDNIHFVSLRRAYRHDKGENAMKKNVIVGQSGGPTAVINASLAGVYKTAKDMGADTIYGMRYGIQGLLEKKIVDLGEKIRNDMDVELLKRTPASFLGSMESLPPI